MANINECRFSLLKYFEEYDRAPVADTSIIIYTDQPHLFQPYADHFKKIVLKQIDINQVNKWRGEQDFIFRVKIKIIQDFFSSYTGNLLYCDGDTYLLQPLEPVFTEIERDGYYMHQFEGFLGDKANAYFRKWNKFLSGNSITYNGKTMVYSAGIEMWNAGVLGMNSNNTDLLNDVLSLTDSIYRQFPKHIAEQFSFGYCMQQKGSIKPAKDFMEHYWKIKEFRGLLERLFDQSENKTIPELVHRVKKIDVAAMEREKEKFNRLSSLQKFIKKLKGEKWGIEQYYHLAD
jgi:hypothetical protein